MARALDLVLPPECVWCGTAVLSGAKLCTSCTRHLARSYSCCQRCSAPLPSVVDPSSCIRCRNQNWRFRQVLALGPYRGRLREAVILMKKPHFEPLAMAAGELLAQKCLDRLSMQETEPVAAEGPRHSEGEWVVVPVPNHWTRRLTHRTSTAETLGQSIADQTGWRFLPNCVARVRRTQKQGILPWSARSQNVRGAFRVRQPKPLAGARVLIVDDVFTSGATVAELTRSLFAARVSQVVVACAARATGSRDAPLENSIETPTSIIEQDATDTAVGR